jgi:indolepyruvate ferredoxin oxidoreductase beta subunit
VAKSLAQLEKRVGRLVSLDADALAHQAGTVLSMNMVILGALARHADLPITVAQMKKAIRSNTRKDFLTINLKAFDLGYKH